MCETGPKPAPSYTDLEQRLSASESARREAEETLRRAQRTAYCSYCDFKTEGDNLLLVRKAIIDHVLACPYNAFRLEADALQDVLASERAAREKAERLLAECDDELENASCPPMTNETIPERIARLAGLVSSTARDEQTALEGKVAAESRLAEAEAVLREIADCQHRYVQTGYASEIHNESECGPCIASAFLAGGKS